MELRQISALSDGTTGVSLKTAPRSGKGSLPRSSRAVHSPRSPLCAQPTVVVVGGVVIVAPGGSWNNEAAGDAE